MSDAGLITAAVAAMKYFCGNFEKTRIFLREFGYIPDMIDKSRFCRRLRQIKGILYGIFSFFSEIWKKLNTDSVYLIDSFPATVCGNIRIPRLKIFRGESYRGYNASRRRYFYGLKVHMMFAAGGEPAEIFMTPGGISDTGATKMYGYDLPEGSTIYGDKAYNRHYRNLILCDHLGPRSESKSEIMQTAACFHHHIPKSFFPISDFVFKNTIPFHTAYRMPDPDSYFRYFPVFFLFFFAEFSAPGFFLWLNDYRIAGIGSLKTVILKQFAPFGHLFLITCLVRRLFIMFFPSACGTQKNDFA